MNLFRKSKATKHWVRQRASAVMMLLLSLVVFYWIMHLTALPQLTDLADNLMVWVFALLFWYTLTHARLGLDIIIEDYMHQLKLRRIILRANLWSSWILKIALIYFAYQIYVGL